MLYFNCLRIQDGDRGKAIGLIGMDHFKIPDIQIIRQVFRSVDDDTAQKENFIATKVFERHFYQPFDLRQPIGQEQSRAGSFPP
jgi:hypothetical protein